MAYVEMIGRTPKVPETTPWSFPAAPSSLPLRPISEMSMTVGVRLQERHALLVVITIPMALKGDVPIETKDTAGVLQACSEDSREAKICYQVQLLQNQSVRRLRSVAIVSRLETLLWKLITSNNWASQSEPGIYRTSLTVRH